MKLTTLFLSSLLFSMTLLARDLTLDNLVGAYELKSSLAKGQSIILELEANQIVQISKIKNGVQSAKYPGQFSLDNYTEYGDSGSSQEQLITLTGTHDGKDLKIVIYFKNVAPRDLARGAYVLADLSMDGKSMNNLWLEMKKQ